MNLRFVEAFYWVATLQSVTRAAEKLCLTQSAMSSRIAALEADLGVLLLDRSLRRVKLTSAGTRFLAHARSMLEFMREARTDIHSASSRRAVMRIGAIESVMHAWLVPWVREIGAEYPELSIEFCVATTPALQDQIVRGMLDLAFTSLPASADGIRVRQLPEQPMVFLASADRYPRPSYTIEELADAQFITSHRGSHSYVALNELFRQHDLSPGVVHSISSLSSMALLAEEGLGIAVMQRAAAQCLVRRPGTRVLTPNPPLLPMSLFASYRADAAGQTTENVMRSAVAFITAGHGRERPTRVSMPEPPATRPPQWARRRSDDAPDPSPARLPAHS